VKSWGSVLILGKSGFPDPSVVAPLFSSIPLPFHRIFKTFEVWILHKPCVSYYDSTTEHHILHALNKKVSKAKKPNVASVINNLLSSFIFSSNVWRKHILYALLRLRRQSRCADCFSSMCIWPYIDRTAWWLPINLGTNYFHDRGADTNLSSWLDGIGHRYDADWSRPWRHNDVRRWRHSMRYHGGTSSIGRRKHVAVFLHDILRIFFNHFRLLWSLFHYYTAVKIEMLTYSVLWSEGMFVARISLGL